MGLLSRCSAEWKAEYKERPIIEMFYSSDKHGSLLDTRQYLNIEKVSLHTAMRSYLATARGHLKTDDYAHTRHMRIGLPPAQRPNIKPGETRELTPTW